MGHVAHNAVRPAFIFVDLLADFFANPVLLESRSAIADAVNDLSLFARSKGYPVIWVRQEFEPDLSNAFLSMRDSGTRITIRGTRGCEVIPELRRESSDLEVVKHRYSAFFETNLAALMRAMNVTHAILGGINTHACVRATAVDAYQLDYRVILATDTIASYDDEYHRESLRYLAQSIGTSMTNSKIKEALDAASHLG
jgi:nicotinamidase-related amidase